jgi:3-oxoacyl-[acyl-carrier-protein] synthase-1
VAEPVRMAQDSQLDPGLMGPARLIEMAATTLEEICRKLEPIRSGFRSIPLLLGLPEERPGWTREHVQAVRRGLSRKTMPIEFQSREVFSQGHAAGLLALDAACTRIRAQQADLCVIGGVDSYLERETLEWLDQNRQLATSYHRGAFLPGEGAGAFVVAADSIVRHYRLDSLAVVRGLGTATEAHRIKTDAVCLGEGLTASIRKAVLSLRLPDEAVEGVICDINGERYRSEEWGFTLLRFPEALVDPTGYDLPASCWGDMGAASGPLFVTLAVTAGRRGWAKGAHAI